MWASLHRPQPYRSKNLENATRLENIKPGFLIKCFCLCSYSYFKFHERLAAKNLPNLFSSHLLFFHLLHLNPCKVSNTILEGLFSLYLQYHPLSCLKHLNYLLNNCFLDSMDASIPFWMGNPGSRHAFMWIFYFYMNTSFEAKTLARTNHGR